MLKFFMEMLEKECLPTPIDGCVLLPLRCIETPDGGVFHMLRPDFPLQPGRKVGCEPQDALSVGEVYFSEVLPGSAKAWKRHSRQTQFFCVPSGNLLLVLYDSREGSPSKGKLWQIKLGRGETYALLRIPCGIFYGFSAIGAAPALLCNVSDLPHDPKEGIKIPWNSEEGRAIPFDWKPFLAQS